MRLYMFLRTTNARNTYTIEGVCFRRRILLGCLFLYGCAGSLWAALVRCPFRGIGTYAKFFIRKVVTEVFREGCIVAKPGLASQDFG